MGCVQSLFNPSKSGSASPEREFVPPTFETVVVTRQPGKSKRSDEPNDNTDIVSQCDDFERHVTEDDGDRHSLHLVEATAVRMLAADTGSLAILGTTAKCKPHVDSTEVHGPVSPEEGQRTQPTTVDDASTPKPQLVVETRCVQATAVRTLAAETGSIAILGTTADPKPQPEKSTRNDEETGSVHYVEATAVGHLAAETGTIAILASTAVVAGLGRVAQKPDGESDDFIPVGVREVLDSEPVQTRKTEQEPTTEKQEENGGERPLETGGDDELASDEGPVEGLQIIDSDPRIPLPVIHAMERKPEVRGGPNEMLKTILSFSSPSEKHVLPPRSATTDGVISGGGDVVFDVSSRKPFIRQSNETREQDELEDLLPPDGWTPKVPVFAKCLAAKSKSLPAKSATSVCEPMYEEGKSNGYVRGSSLPYDRDIDEEENLLNYTKQESNDVMAIPNPASLKLISSDLAQTNVIIANMIGTNVVDTNVVKLQEIITNVVNLDAVQPNVEEANFNKWNSIGSKENESVSPKKVVPNSTRTNCERPYVVVPGINRLASVESKVVRADSIGTEAVRVDSDRPKTVRADSIGPKIVRGDSIRTEAVRVDSDGPKIVPAKSIGPKVVPVDLVELEPIGPLNRSLIPEESADGATVVSETGGDASGRTTGMTAEVSIVENVVASEKKVPSDRPKERENGIRGSPGADGTSTVTTGSLAAGNTDVDAESDADAEYRLTMIQSVREAVNRICEQAVERTAAIVKSGRGRPSAVATQTSVRGKGNADESEVSEFSLPPPPPPPGTDLVSIGQESSWPPPPHLSEAEEERTIAPGFSFDLPDPPTEMDQMDLETDKLDISDEEMRATGLPSDEEELTDTETGRYRKSK